MPVAGVRARVIAPLERVRLKISAPVAGLIVSVYPLALALVTAETWARPAVGVTGIAASYWPIAARLRLASVPLSSVA